MTPANAVQPKHRYYVPETSLPPSPSLVSDQTDQLELLVLFLGEFLLEFQLGHELCESERAADVDRRRGDATRRSGRRRRTHLAPCPRRVRHCRPPRGSTRRKRAVRRRRSERRCAPPSGSVDRGSRPPPTPRSSSRSDPGSGSQPHRSSLGSFQSWVAGMRRLHRTPAPSLCHHTNRVKRPAPGHPASAASEPWPENHAIRMRSGGACEPTLALKG
jgi:hypothetical protein